MKIAIVSPVMVSVPPKKYGGIELIVDAISCGLARRGHYVTVFCSGGSTIKEKNINRVEVSPYPTSEHIGENRQWEIKQMLTVLAHQHEFDMIHFNYEPIVLRFDIDGIIINLLDFFVVPVVLTFHNTTDISSHIQYYRETASLHKHGMVFVSENQRRPVSFLPNAKVIYNAIHIENFSVGIKKQKYFLFLGRITPFKGILEAIAVAQKTQIPLYIVAKIDSIDRDFYEEEVKNKIDNVLIFYMGEADFSQKISYLKKAYCLLFPITWEEPFGLVMVEALACGTPVIAFRRGAVLEIIQDGVNGFVVDTIDEMIEATKNIATISPSECRKSVEKRFNVGRMVDEYEELFKNVIVRAKMK